MDDLLRSIESVTLGEIMGEDMTVWLGLNKASGYDMSIDDENLNPLARYEQIHPFAVNALADFSRCFLFFYDAIQSRLEKKETIKEAA
jgi:hypothetical protein